MEALNLTQMDLVAGGQSVLDSPSESAGAGAAAGGSGAISGMEFGSALGDVAAAGTIGSIAGAGLGLEAYAFYQVGTAIYNSYDVQIGNFIDATVNFFGSPH